MTQSGTQESVSVGVVRESAPRELRVAVVPDSVQALARLGAQVLVESGAGEGAWFPDSAYEQAGAAVVGPGKACDADVVVGIGAPAPERIARLRAGQAVIGLLRPLTRPELASRLAAAGVTAISLDGLPRTVSRAQAMDALTSQASVAGYKAAVLAADHFGRFFPMLITAAGTSRPASVLVLGAGVAGLQAMGTARRLGAVVTGYDVRPETRDQIESVGARFLELKSVASAAGQGGYARALTADEQAGQQAELAAEVARFDIVITTAQVPGRRPPLLVSAEAVKGMRAGSVVVDLAASSLGGNVADSAADQTVLTENGVRVIGAGHLAAQMPAAASIAYSHNIVALLAELIRDGALTIDPADEIQAGVVITHQGRVIHPQVAALLQSTGGDPQ